MSQISLRTREFYKQHRFLTKFHKEKESIEAFHVGWSSPVVQQRGFELASDFPWIQWCEVKSVLDLGCGYGNLLDFLLCHKAFAGDYHGIDIISECIDVARSRYHKLSHAFFYEGDFLEQSLAQNNFDLVISVGAICVNHDYPEPYGKKSMVYAQRIISKIAKASNLGFSIYFPHAQNTDLNRRQLGLAYYTKPEIESMVRESTGARFVDMTFTSFSDPSDFRTIAKVRLKDIG
ncbi:MAG: methyltransferase domain-containing protein [Mariprofundaceae bacterium]|nr:methyltransferase domain-containing protein [Mariprofundaceae bacterium]